MNVPTDIILHTYKFLDLKDYYNASVAFQQTNKDIERNKRFEWASKRIKTPAFVDGYCAEHACERKKAACIFFVGDTPKYIILSNYCSTHEERQLF